MPPDRHPDWQRDSWDWYLEAGQLPAIAVSMNSVTANTVLFTGRCLIKGWSLANTGGSSGSLEVVDGTNSTGRPILAISFGSGASSSSTAGSHGIILEIGAYAIVSTATLLGSLWFVPLWHYKKTPPGR